ncbi:hypothetical protein HN51_016529 [Arachis hypogaea]
MMSIGACSYRRAWRQDLRIIAALALRFVFTIVVTPSKRVVNILCLPFASTHEVLCGSGTLDSLELCFDDPILGLRVAFYKKFVDFDWTIFDDSLRASVLTLKCYSWSFEVGD